MIDQKLNEYHDLAIENNDFATITGAPEMLQAVSITLLTIKYEWWLDGTLGIPWNHGMFQPYMTQAEKLLHTKRALLSVAGVNSVDGTTYSHDQINRSDLIELSLDTVEGRMEQIGVEVNGGD